MRYRPFGSSGFQASELGIGDLADRAVPAGQCVATLQRAMDRGMNIIDTAPGYEDGYSEEVVGKALEGRRDTMFVIDKIDEPEAPVEPQIDASLKRLNLDCVDLFAFHGVSDPAIWDRLAAPSGGMEQLMRCVDAGKVRYRGISSHHPDVLRSALDSGLCDVVMFPIGAYVDPRYVEEILPLARKKGVGTVCFKTFGAGKLLGDTAGYNRPLEARPRGKFSSGGTNREGESGLPRLTVAECLHYTLTVGPDVALLGLSFPNEQDEAFRAYDDFEPLSAGAMRDIRNRAEVAIREKGPCWWNPAPANEA